MPGMLQLFHVCWVPCLCAVMHAQFLVHVFLERLTVSMRWSPTMAAIIGAGVFSKGHTPSGFCQAGDTHLA
jgi:hypothetical protein